MIKAITLIFIALYPVMPDYFRIFGLPSGAVLASAFVLLSFLNINNLFIIKKRDASVALAVTILLCTPYVVHREYTTAIKNFIEYALVFLMLGKYFKKREQIDQSLKIIITVASITCFFGLFEFVTGKSLFTPFYSGVSTDLSPTLQMRGAFSRSEASFGHAITYAIYLGMCALLDSMYIIKTNRLKYKVIYILLVVTLFTTMSRAPIILFVFCQLIVLYLFGFKKLISTVIKVVAGLMIVGGVIFVMAPSLFSNFQYMINVVLAIFSEGAASQVGDIQNANPFDYRLKLLEIIPQYIKGSLLFGHGISLSLNFSILGHTYVSIDNGYLVWLFRYGIVGFFGNSLLFV